ncbi:hypothetical protein SLA2020_316660 [Shorea laevis]
MQLLFLEKVLLSLSSPSSSSSSSPGYAASASSSHRALFPCPYSGTGSKLAMTSTTATSPTSLASLGTFSCSAWANATSLWCLPLSLPNRSSTRKASSSVHEQETSSIFDIFTSKGQDMVFTVYGEHWRKMRRIMTVPFFTNKVVQQYRPVWLGGRDCEGC